MSAHSLSMCSELVSPTLPSHAAELGIWGFLAKMKWQVIWHLFIFFQRPSQMQKRTHVHSYIKPWWQLAILVPPPGKKGPVHTSVLLQPVWFKIKQFICNCHSPIAVLGTGTLSPPRCASLMTDQAQQWHMYSVEITLFINWPCSI